MQAKLIGDLHLAPWSFNKSHTSPIIGCILRDSVWTLDERAQPSSNRQGYYVKVERSQVLFNTFWVCPRDVSKTSNMVTKRVLSKVQFEGFLYYLHSSKITSPHPPLRMLKVPKICFCNFPILSRPEFMSDILLYFSLCISELSSGSFFYLWAFQNIFLNLGMKSITQLFLYSLRWLLGRSITRFFSLTILRKRQRMTMDRTIIVGFWLGHQT